MSAPCFPGVRSLFEMVCTVRDKTIRAIKGQREIRPVPLPVYSDSETDSVSDDFTF